MTAASAELVQVRYHKLKNIHFSVSCIQNEQVHVHSSVELVVVLSGTLQVRAGDRTYSASCGDLLLFNSYEIHCLTPQPEAKLLFLHLGPSFAMAYFAQFASVEFDYTPQALPEPLRRELTHAIVEAAIVFYLEPEAFGLECAGLVCNAVTALLRNVPYTLNSDAEHMAKKKKIGRRQRIASYVEQHYRDKLTLSQLAQAEGITTAYMSRIFGELFSNSFQDYLSKLRLQKALPMLKKPSIYLVDICMECGFSDTRYLNAVCQKEYGCSAAKLREKMQDPDWTDPFESRTEDQAPLDDEESLQLLDAFLSYP